MSDLQIPADLLPADGRFGCGPTKVRVDALDALAATGDQLLGTSHRKARVRDQVARLRGAMAELFSLPDGHEVLLMPGGATAFWDAAAFGLVEQRSRHYVFGEFSDKFAKVTAGAPFLDEPEVVAVPPGTVPAITSAGGAVDVQALTHNETSTGAMLDPVRADDALVLVDATSGAGGLPLDPREVDGYYFSLQKGFAAEGGLTAILASPALLERIDRVAADRWVPAYFDLRHVVTNSRKEQTYNTPSVSTIFLAAEQAEWMLDQGGLDEMVRRGEAKRDVLMDWAGARDWASPFVADPAARSLVVSTIDIDDALDADEINRHLRANGVLDSDSYRKLGRNQLRVGTFPAVDRGDLEAYTACVDWLVERM